MSGTTNGDGAGGEAWVSRERARLLHEVLALTPRATEELDLSALREALGQRQQLLDRLPSAPTGPVARTPEARAAEAACRSAIGEVRARDAALRERLEQVRAETSRLLLKLRTRQAAGTLFDQTA